MSNNTPNETQPGKHECENDKNVSAPRGVESRVSLTVRGGHTIHGYGKKQLTS